MIRTVRRSAVFRIAANVIGAVILAEMLLVWLPAVWRRTDIDRDVHVYYLGARAVLEGRPLYRPYPGYGPYIHASPEHLLPADRFFNPPLVFVIASPLASLPFLTFARIWYLAILVAFYVYAGCLACLATGRVTWTSLSVAAILLLGLPWTAPAMVLGNIDPILWALFGLALVSLRLRGPLFALVAMVKVHTMWPLALASWHDRARVYLPAAGVILIGVLIGALAPGGLWAWVDWARYAAPSEPAQGTFNSLNFSLSFAGLRIARALGWHYEIGPLPLAARLYLTAMGLSAPLITMRLVRRLERTLQYACITTAAVLFAPLCWSCYLALPLAAVMLAYRSVVEAAQQRAGLNAENLPEETAR